MSSFRVGIGFDVHKLVTNRKLILGGITIDHKLGALGHSDADVLIHAIADALLGAAALGDIGMHFPDTAPENSNLKGSIILKSVQNLLSDKGFEIVNIDSTVILQNPKINKKIPEIRQNIADILNIDVINVSVKATTTEKLGAIGREEGIAAEAIVLIQN